jgi:lipopolysaccharide export LptBFGC system permease protein LptF
VRRVWLIPAVLVTAILVALLEPGAAGSKDATQQFFEARLLADKETSSQVKKLLQSEGGFVDKNVVFKDVTDDDRDDAVVRVHSGGAAGVVAVYVFSTANKKNGKLRAIFRSEKLMRASTRVLKNEVSYRTARYAPGDELCCPARLTQSTLAWDPDERRMRVAERVTFAPPPEAQAPAAPDAP